MSGSLESTSVIDFLEAFFGSRLDPEFVAGAVDLPAEQITELYLAYVDWASATEAPSPGGRLQPYNYGFTHTYNLVDDPAPGEPFLNLAMSQLLYAHRVVFRDSLSHGLATWAHGKTSIETPHPMWERESSRRAFRDYLSTLLYLRPLIDSRLVLIAPYAILREDMWETPDALFFPDDGAYLESHLEAAEFVGGLERRRAEEEYHSRSGSRGPDEHSDAQRMMTGAFDRLRRKFEAQSVGLGDLSLESDVEATALAWTLSKMQGTNISLGERALIHVQTITMPVVPRLQPWEVVALHEHPAWEDYRLAVSRVLEFSNTQELTGNELRHLTNEVAAVQRAVVRASRSTSLTEARYKTTRDIGIGVAVGASLAPATGLAPAALTAAGLAGRSLTSLAWDWLRSRPKARQEGGLLACFTALADGALGMGASSPPR